MDSIDKYCGEVYYIISTLTDEKVPSELKTTLKADVLKCMAIGSTLLVGCRYMLSNRFYQLKNYLNSFLIGSIFGLCYSPAFLALKIDKYRLNQLLS